MIDLLYSLYTTTDIMTLINKIDDGKCIMSSSVLQSVLDKKKLPNTFNPGIIPTQQVARAYCVKPFDSQSVSSDFLFSATPLRPL